MVVGKKKSWKAISADKESTAYSSAPWHADSEEKPSESAGWKPPLPDWNTMAGRGVIAQCIRTRYFLPDHVVHSKSFKRAIFENKVTQKDVQAWKQCFGHVDPEG